MTYQKPKDCMRMPKVGDRVICLDDESLGTVVYLTAGGSPQIKFDDGSHGAYMLHEFADLFGYTSSPDSLTFDEWYSSAIWGNEDFKEGCRRAWNASMGQDD